MKQPSAATTTIDAYIAAAPKDVRNVLQEVRATIRKAAPDAEETISYRIPTFRLHGYNLIYFAAFKTHIGLYPAPTGEESFKKEVALYGAGKGTFRFSLDKPVPRSVITKVVKFRAKENLERATAKKKKTGG